MNDTNKNEDDDPGKSFPRIREVGFDAPWRWLKAGSRDLRRARGSSLFYGMCFAIAGWMMQLVFAHAYALFAGLATGFLLLGPCLSMGLYDISRHLERGETPRLGASRIPWGSTLGNIGVFAAVLAVILLVWARASMVIFALSYNGGVPSFADVLRAVFGFEQPAFALIYFASGGLFALLVFAISVVAMPLMLDRNTDAVTAAIASLIAFARNPGPLLLWAACIVALTALGFATFFVGLIFTTPLIGHASWHAYRDLVEPAQDITP
ncbi:MAG: DUF2189 domain-containing protein [Burkholderiales bacterium]|nr:DUF2189 domain-containing protein [Burkholderiales bacterium]